jgi:thymidylate synthase ThyX
MNTNATAADSASSVQTAFPFFRVEVIEASEFVDEVIGMWSPRLVTMQLTYPRFIHAEFLRHRVFSHSVSSSRAIPVARMLADIKANPAFFTHIGKNQAGMSAAVEVEDDVKAKFKDEWLELLEITSKYVTRWSDEYKIHKQVANRAAEPWQLINQVVTSTAWGNFFELRCHEDAQPEIHELALLMRDAYYEADFKLLSATSKHQWHLPYIKEWEREAFHTDALLRMSTARCARSSYNNHDGTSATYEEDAKLFKRLLGSRPLHASPSEHQATPVKSVKNGLMRNLLGLPVRNDYQISNLQGWNQLRRFVESGDFS